MGVPSKVGSLSSMSIVGDFLYVLDLNYLVSFDISDPESVEQKFGRYVDNRVETTFSMDDYLLIGGDFGVYAYEVESNGRFSPVSRFTHARACDPVVADREYMYITLRSAPGCIDENGESNVLKVVNITDIRRPKLVQNYPMKSPIGLTLSDDVLFVCDHDSLKVYDKSNPEDLRFVTSEIVPGCVDVIHNQDSIIITAKEKLFQFEFVDEKLKLLSVI